MRYWLWHLSNACKVVCLECVSSEHKNWRFQWRNSIRYLTQKWTLSKTLQISHVVLFRYVKQCSACFFPWSLLPFWGITYVKKHIFSKGLLNQKQKKPFVSLGDEVTEISEQATKLEINIFWEHTLWKINILY